MGCGLQGRFSFDDILFHSGDTQFSCEVVQNLTQILMFLGGQFWKEERRPQISNPILEISSFYFC